MVKRSSIGRGTAVLVLMMVGAIWSVELAAEGAARAQQRDPRELEAKTACLAGRSERGIELLAQLYAETNDPTYIYNQARCFEQNGKSREAVTRFREYLRKSPGIVAVERTQVQARISELEAQQQQPTPAPASPPPATAPVAPVPASPAGSPAASPGPDQASNREISVSGSSGTRAGRGLRIAGISAAGIGVLGVFTGIYMHSRAVTLSRDVTDAARQGNFDAGKYDDGRRAETLQWVGYTVGAAALLAGGTLYLLGASEQTSSDNVSLMALPSLNGGFSTSVRLLF